MPGRLAVTTCLAFLLQSVTTPEVQVTGPRTPTAASPGSAVLKKALKRFDEGVPKPDRIVGGSDTTIEKHPWQVALLAARIADNYRAQFCGGSVIAPRWVLTAAHCVDEGTQADQVSVLAGATSLSGGGGRAAVTEIIVHDQWNSLTHDFDIALLRVGRDLSGGITGDGPAAVEPAPGAPLTVTGWGAVAWGALAGTRTLQEVGVPAVSRARCNTAASYNGSITANMLCAGKGGADSCQGDSGGPLTVGSPARFVGVVSWGKGCAIPEKYGVYTRVSRFATWVTTNTEGAVRW